MTVEASAIATSTQAKKTRRNMTAFNSPLKNKHPFPAEVPLQPLAIRLSNPRVWQAGPSSTFRVATHGPAISAPWTRSGVP
jgi:hypothetical protein